MCRDLFVTVGALFLRSRRMVGMLGLHRIPGCAPCRQPTAECPCLPALLSEKLRHTGAGAFVRSSAVSDDLAVGGQALEVPQDLRNRARRLQTADDRSLAEDLPDTGREDRDPLK